MAKPKTIEEIEREIAQNDNKLKALKLLLRGQKSRDQKQTKMILGKALASILDANTNIVNVNEGVLSPADLKHLAKGKYANRIQIKQPQTEHNTHD